MQPHPPPKEKREGENVYEKLARIVLCDVTVIYVSYVNTLYFPRTVHLYFCPRTADKGLININFFELICKCIL